MDVNTLRIIVTVESFLLFMGIVAFALYPGNQARFDVVSCSKGRLHAGRPFGIEPSSIVVRRSPPIWSPDS